MDCPYCRNPKTEVYNSRHHGQPYVWRRRRCRSCQRAFTTHETVNMSFISVIDKNGRKLPYRRVELMFSLYEACRNSGTDIDSVEHLANTIESRLLDLGTEEINKSQITDTAMSVLKRYDPAVFIRYLSNRTDIASLKQLKTELKELQATE